jgi:Flp pilus assembly protein TadG
MLKRIFGALCRRREGSVSIIAAVILPILIGVAGLVAEYGNGLLHKVEDQRVADAAAFAAATAYNANPSVSITGVAQVVAGLNGVSTTGVTATKVASPSGDGNQAIEVNVSTQTPLLLSKVLGSTQGNLTETATSYAEMKNAAPGCVIALSSSGTGVTVTSSAGITADACAVDSNAAVTAQSSSNITTIQVDYNSSSPPSATSSSTIAAPAGKSITISKAATSDPLAGNSEVTAATAHLSTVESLTSPSAPSVPSGANVSCASGALCTGTLPAGCSQSKAGSTVTITCPSGATYDFGSLSVTSTETVNLVVSGSSATTFNFSGGITASSSGTFTAAAGTYNIAQGVTVASSSSAKFGAGTFDIGPTASNCSDGFKYSLCVESSTSLTFGGPSSFTLAAGLYAGSSANITLGAGTTNSFDIGKGGSGDAVQTSSSSNVVFADATGSSDLFEAVGVINAASSACVALPDAAAHDINGALVANSSSNTTLGAGVYTVSGYLVDQSSSGGGGCLGSTAGTAGTGVTFVLGAATTPSSGTCNGEAICITSSSGLSLIAPTSGATAGLAVIGPTDGSTAGALFESSSSGSLSGAVYLPTGAIQVSSSASLGGGAGVNCLELIGSQVSVTSSSAIGSSCAGLGGSASGTGVVLVQ